jgi:Rieske Fe-S protein
MSDPFPPAQPEPAPVADDSAGKGPDRRGLIVGAAVTAVAGVAGYVVASGDRTENAGQAGSSSSAGDGGGAGGGGSAAAPLATVADIPSGGGVIDKEAAVVVVKEGDQVRAYSAKCTHQGCIVSSVKGGTINCNCHQSKFAIATGEPVDGPAPRALPPVRVEVRNGSVFRA